MPIAMSRQSSWLGASVGLKNMSFLDSRHNRVGSLAMATKDTGGQKRAAKHEETEEVVDETTTAADASDAVQERHDKLTDDVDALLDEIDGVLEENAEEFVRAYVQKGGE